jgi:hypothetical protein
VARVSIGVERPVGEEEFLQERLIGRPLDSVE